MKTNQLKAGAFLNYTIILLNAAVGLIYTPYMLHKLGQSEYGLYSLVSSVIAYLTLMDFGFGNAVVRYTAKYRAEGKYDELHYLFGMFFILYCIISILVFIGGFSLYLNTESMFGDTMNQEEIERAKIMMLILTFNMSFTFIFHIFGSIITAFEKFVFQKTIQIIRLILNTITMVLLLHLEYKAIAMVVVLTIFNVSSLLINLLYCKSKLDVKIKFGHFDKQLAAEIAVYAFWIFLNAIMDKIYWSTGQFILGITSGTIAVSVFAVAINFEHMYMSFSTAISSVFLPKVTAMVAQNKSNEEISELFIKTGRIQFIVMAFILTAFFVLGSQFIKIWAGEEYSVSYYITFMFFAALFIPLIQNMGITILQARNQMKFRCILYIIIAFVSLIGQIILSKEYGAYGCAISISAALIIGQGIIMNIYYKRKQGLDITKFWKEILKMSISPCVIAVISFMIFKRLEIQSYTIFFLCATVFSAVYIPCFWFFSMNDYERQLIKEPIKKLLRKKLS